MPSRFRRRPAAPPSRWSSVRAPSSIAPLVWACPSAGVPFRSTRSCGGGWLDGKARAVGPRAMMPLRPKRRCTECRCWYEPSSRAAQTQRTCGPWCRQRRRRRLARQRRGRDVQEARVAERERQRRRRAALRAQRQRAGGGESPATVTRHAPPSAAMYAELQEKLRQSVDTAMELSRAALLRVVQRILGDIARSAAAARTETATATAPVTRHLERTGL